MAKTQAEKKPHYFWDSCIFIAWLKDGRGTMSDETLSGIRAMHRNIQLRNAQLTTSVMTRVEVMDVLRDERFEQQWQELWKRETCQMYNVDPRVTDQALKLRGEFGLLTPDAIQLSSAVILGADYFVTMDGARSQPANQKSEKILVHREAFRERYDLILCTPESDQLEMAFDE